MEVRTLKNKNVSIIFHHQSALALPSQVSYVLIFLHIRDIRVQIIGLHASRSRNVDNLEV